jgi:hypothetical protein
MFFGIPLTVLLPFVANVSPSDKKFTMVNFLSQNGA